MEVLLLKSNLDAANFFPVMGGSVRLNDGFKHLLSQFLLKLCIMYYIWMDTSVRVCLYIDFFFNS